MAEGLGNSGSLSKSVMSSNGRLVEKPILLPCTCGQSIVWPIEFKSTEDGWSRIRYGYWCRSCGNVTTPCFTSEDARLEWNRKMEPDPQEHVKKLILAREFFATIVDFDDEPMHNDLPMIHTSTERLNLLEERMKRVEAIIKTWTGGK